MNARNWLGGAATAALVVTALATSGRVAAAQGAGTMTHNGVAMNVKGVVAVWDAKRPAVAFYLLPFEPTAAEVALLQKRDTMWLLEKDRTDPNMWKPMPYGSLTLNWSFEPKAVGDLTKAWTDVYSFAIGRPNSNLNFSLTGGELKGTLGGPLQEGSLVTLATTGQGEMEKDKLSWNVKLTAKLLPALAR